MPCHATTCYFAHKPKSTILVTFGLRQKLSDANWGGLPDQHRLGKPTPLFPRIEIDKGV